MKVGLTKTSSIVESAKADNQAEERLRLFICYSSANAAMLRELKPSLTILERHNYIAPWSDAELVPGEDWDETIQEKLAEAQLILFLVSRHFLASKYITDKERPLAMRLYGEGKVIIVPILLSACMWGREDFAKFENLPEKGRLVSDIRPREKAWAKTESGIIKAVEKFRAGKKLIEIPLESTQNFRAGSLR